LTRGGGETTEHTDVHPTPPGFESREVEVSPFNFECNSTLTNVNARWFVNLSNKQIPTDIQLLLQLGHRFNLPLRVGDKERTIVEFIKNIKKNIANLSENLCNSIRNESLPILNKFKNYNPGSKYYNNLISRWAAATKDFTKKNPDLLFTRADKGNVNVNFSYVKCIYYILRSSSVKFLYIIKNFFIPLKFSHFVVFPLILFHSNIYTLLEMEDS